VDKAAVVSLILAELDAELASYARSAKSAHEEATNEQSKAENKYDTRGLEASYLAKGQSRMAQECIQARDEITRIGARAYPKGSPIDVGALVTIKTGKESSTYFVAPKGGGTEVAVAGVPVLVITPQSPLGQQIIGRAEGDRFPLKLAGATSNCAVLSVV
jgi:transcription elongation GreA/GreB family factor